MFSHEVTVIIDCTGIDDCNPSLCNDGTCVDGVRSYTCDCSATDCIGVHCQECMSI